MKSDTTIRTFACERSCSPSKTDERIEADIVLLHKKDSSLYPTILYQLPNGILDPHSPAESIRNAFFSHHRTFVPLGSILTLNKKLKQVVLGDGSLVLYKYLIIVFDPDSDEFYRDQHQQFTPGVSALIDALLLKDKFSFVDSTTTTLFPNSLKSVEFFGRKSPFQGKMCYYIFSFSFIYIFCFVFYIFVVEV
jgi:hypothetical protein